MRATSTIAFRGLLLALLGLAAAVAQARSLTIEVATLASPSLRASDLRLRLDADAAGADLRLTMRALHAAAAGLHGDLDLACRIQRAADGSGRCEGPVRLAGADGTSAEARFELELADRQFGLALSRDGARAELQVPTGGSMRARLQQVPSAWLRPALAAAWPAGMVEHGVVDLDATIARDGGVEATWRVTDFALATHDGALSMVLADAAGRAQLRQQGERFSLALEAALLGGSMHAGTLGFDLPEAPVDFEIDLQSRADGIWLADRFAWRDRGVLELEGSAAFEPGAVAPLRSLDVRVLQARLPVARDRYAASLLRQLGAQGLTMAGELSGELAVDVDGVRQVRLHSGGLDVADAARGFRMTGVHGGIDWVRSGERPPSLLGWRGGELQGYAIPAAQGHWRVRDGTVQLADPLYVALPSGSLRLQDAAVRMPAEGEWFATRFVLDGAGYERADGLLAFADVAAEGSLRVSGTIEAPRLRLQARWNGAKALAGSFYVELPPEAVTSTLDVVAGGDRWQVRELHWNDPGTLELQARGEVEPAAPRPLRGLRLDLQQVDLRTAVDRYARSWLSTAGWPALAATGSVSGKVEVEADDIRSFSLVLDAVSIDSGDDRVRVSGLAGAVDWDRAATLEPTRLGWDALGLFGIEMAAARANLQSKAGAIGLVEPLAIGVLGGELRIENLALEPRSPRGERYSASFAIAGIEMARLSQVFGWPAFPGNLSGGIPEVVLSGDVIELHGGLDLYAFDGHLGMNSLRLERPFGVAPSLAANVHFENLDLEQVTQAFSFGGMSGRLFGTIGELRLVDWSPVAFDAWLRTRGGGRMSYNAVSDVASIGGGSGLGGGVQAMALQVFDTFGYRQLGIRCRLAEDVCHMGGIDPAADDASGGAGGYTIVEGSGLPRIRIVGHHRRVDWPTLVSRLVEATQGQGPVMR